ncbi:hypothetical protein [Clostridium tyrobutyricum]|uniref:hypothetical protein n=1 Tax=Clostridium tyrobutyricum TaxID=1519 RepID=UPI00031AD03D|nr:hypothetical protein [Clostridium tyrobutyricum]
MNCHENNSNENGKGGHNGIGHIIMMILCCAVPVILVASLPFFGIAPKFKIIIASVAPFICPIMMFLMIPLMFLHSKKNKCHKSKKINN